MASHCISGCVDAHAPVRATYTNLYKWPESDAEFVKSVSRNGGCPRVVESYSCRQMYLRSYTFSKKESVHVRTRKCIGRVKERVVPRTTKRKGGGRKRKRRRKRCVVLRKVRELTCAALVTIFQRLLSCTTSVDVVDR
ncbi:uncharacterized protein LOC131244620 [Magnolia sinica]|uniref:uncharacterized protein LOC131244620 n=1 Tax=Magnolia sinica TaxID=86752 RepID=UPI00265B5F84|nr:uncharacterized protein LOC131244620 [Magnolia sinica]